jgi:hypothetical protein
VYQRSTRFVCLVVAITLAFAGLAIAQTTTASTSPITASTGTLHGHIADPTGAVIPGATISITNALGVTARTVTSDASGSFSATGLPAGSYIVQATVKGFAQFTSQTLSLEAGQSKRVDISMAIGGEQQSVEVVDEEGAPEVSTEAGANANAIVLKGKDLDALSDDPDELSNELSALAGPSAGPNGGQIYIDGFTGGTLPPKSAIREIRINQNPFSAEFERPGYGRVEILTKPGTDVLHGRASVQGNDSSFNTKNPFAPPPAYHSIQYGGTVSGALNKKASYFLSLESRDSPDASVYTVVYPTCDHVTNLCSLQYDANGNPIATTGARYSPSNRIEFSPRIDLQLGQKDTLTFRYQFEHSSRDNSFGTTAMPTQATGSSGSENAIQLTNAYIVSDHMVNETRFQFRRQTSNSTSASTAPSVGVSGYFSAGGSSSQLSNNSSSHIELQNASMLSAGAHAIKFGLWARDNRNTTASSAGFNGSFSFPSLNAYLATVNGIAQGHTVAYIAANCPVPGACTPNRLNYTAGNQNFASNVFDAALYFQDDWKVNRFLTLSSGLRWETQNHIADHSDFGPRFALAYALDGHKKGTLTKTVVRAGFGFFYDRFGSLMTLEQNNGGPNSQQQITINNPTCYSETSLSDALSLSTTGPNAGSNCNSGSAKTPQIYMLAPHYHSPYSEQFGASLERQVSKTATVTLTYMRTYGVHQMATRDENAFETGTFVYGDPKNPGTRPDSSQGIVREFYPEAIFKQNQFVVHANTRLTRSLNIMGFYTLNFANDNTGIASNSYNLMDDYGPASFARRNMFTAMASYTGKWGISYSPMLVVQSGHPFNITTNTDLTGDNFFNSRPAFASSSTQCTGNARYVQTQFGCLDVIPQSGETLLPVNLGRSTSSMALNLRMSRSFGLGPETSSPAAQSRRSGRDSQGQPGSYSGISSAGGGHGGGGHGGGGGMHGSSGSTGRKYSLNFSAQAQNLFNNINYGTPSGSVIPTLISGSGATAVYGPGSRFNKATSLAGGMFGSPSGSASRRIYIQAAFSF